MSLNLCKTECDVCGSTVKITGVPYRVEKTDLYQAGRLVADAICTVCGAKYVAWMSARPGDVYGSRDSDRRQLMDHGFFDLSYRSTFNDEPGVEDLPVGKIEIARVVLIDGRVVAWQVET